MLKENGVKRHYGRINENILIEALAQGKTKIEAGRLAGSLGTRGDSIINAVDDKLSRNPILKKTLIEKLEAFQHKVIDSIHDEEIERASLSQKMIGFGISVEKSQLLKGDPTQRIAVMPKMVIDEIEAPVRGEIVEPKQIEKEGS